MSSTSTGTKVLSAVPQVLVFKPILFLLNTADLLRLVGLEQLHLHSSFYADDMQIYGFCVFSAAFELQNKVSACVAEVSL